MPLSAVFKILPQDLDQRRSEYFLDTKHLDTMVVGFALHPVTQTEERYMLKFYPLDDLSQKNARREVMFTYLLAELGHNELVPRTGLVHVADRPCVIRKFYPGHDARVLVRLDELEAAAHGMDRDSPAATALARFSRQIPNIPVSTLVANYALRYVLCGDLDYMNAGNVIFTPPGEGSTDWGMINIDGEDTNPDGASMSQYLDCDFAESRGDAVPGSLAWRAQMSKRLGAEEFFARMVDSDNPMMVLLRRLVPREQLPKLEFDPTRALAARQAYQQLCLAFDLFSGNDIVSGRLNFQQVFLRWGKQYRKQPITLFQLVTGRYSV